MFSLTMSHTYKEELRKAICVQKQQIDIYTCECFRGHSVTYRREDSIAGRQTPHRDK